MPIQGNGMNDVLRRELSQTLEARLDRALGTMRDELLAAMTKHAPMHSPHEGHSVIREELEELWEHVRSDTGQSRAARKEAFQVAAMGLRYALDLCSDEQVKSAEEAIAYKNRP